jgi:hypothetical protein
MVPVPLSILVGKCSWKVNGISVGPWPAHPILTLDHKVLRVRRLRDL